MSRAGELLRLIEATHLLQPKHIDDELSDVANKWDKVKRNIEVLDVVAKKLASRISESGDTFGKIVSKSSEQVSAVDKAINSFESRKNPSHKYSLACLKAIALVTTDFSRTLDLYHKTCTSDSVISLVKPVDPDMEEWLQHLKTISPDELDCQMDAVIAIPDKPMKTDEALTDSIKKWADDVIAQASKLIIMFSRVEKSSNKLQDTVKKEDEDSRK